MIPSDIRLYTWIDVQEVLYRKQKENNWPEWLIWATAYWDNLTIGITPSNLEVATKWLEEIFEPRFQSDIPCIILESLQANDQSRDSYRLLPIIFEDTEEKPVTPRLTPSLSKPTVIWQKTQATPEFPTLLASDLPPLVAFHSFKGGVGRTTHALALAKVLATEKKKVLIVDGDLEAPGISWIFKQQFPNPLISFADFLALVHGDSSEDAENAIQLVADRLADAVINGIYVLPCFRSTQQITSLEIRPEHLIQGAKNPFILTQVLSRLGKVLGVDVVVIDLRAGLSELAAGLILDPRVYRIFVTTLSEQSILGTIELLKLIADRAPSTREEDPLPALIISQVPQDYLEQGVVLDREIRLLEAAKSFLDENQEPLRLITQFTDNLLVLPPTWEEVISRLQRTDIIDTVKTLLNWLPIQQGKAVAEDVPNLKSQRENLKNLTQRLEYAENAEVDSFFPTIPIRKLASDYSHRIPITVVVGAKGSGKTYTFIQILRRDNWQNFARDAQANEVPSNPLIGVVLKSKNLNNVANDLVENRRKKTAEALNFDSPIDIATIRDYIRNYCQENLHEGQWRERWLDLIAWGVGFKNNTAGAGRNLTEYLVKVKQKLVIIIDGLEDLFQDFSNDSSQQIALRSLLQEVPEWLSQQPSQPLGIIIFVRRDLVLAAIHQNVAQMMSRYDPYALKWNREEALRLVVWVIVQSGIEIENVDKLQDMNEDELTQILIPLWGKKLGKDNSREAASANFVMSAFSDFKGQIQARDLVRFLHLAALQSIDDNRWQDRLLIPTAIKGALPECGVKKIQEIELENPALKNIFAKLRELTEEKKKIPFSRDNIQLSLEEIKILEDNGVVILEGDDYYMPEIFRKGLNFSVTGAGRSKVLYIARRAAQRMK